MAATEPVPRVLKVLVIHGYRQSAKSSREKTGSFRKGLKKYLDLEYGWWFSKRQNSLSFNAHEQSEIDPGHEASVELIKKTFIEQGPFDGLLGFSQGATMAAHICALREQEETPFQFKFAILCAGFKSRSTAHQKYYNRPITCPVLHVYGDTDQVIPKEMSLELEELFTDSTVLNHPGGHYLPATATERKVYQQFLDRFRT
ncbi:esterase OVCA2-like isoform X3 [Hydractinia symbiolongicarpus]|uniref:esterase OVCA2-like isoform X3 n=1 Tax=Hydractinia symbiolongicarpus TaxID=13093 RepID=UPI00254EE90D|nr:esterase OVCA2-like isoform X3 [Hydractinia symbiolongicarpus]